MVNSRGKLNDSVPSKSPDGPADFSVRTNLNGDGSKFDATTIFCQASGILFLSRDLTPNDQSRPFGVISGGDETGAAISGGGRRSSKLMRQRRQLPPSTDSVNKLSENATVAATPREPVKVYNDDEPDANLSKLDVVAMKAPIVREDASDIHPECEAVENQVPAHPISDDDGPTFRG